MNFAPTYLPTLIREAVVANLADGEIVVATPDSRNALVLNESAAIVLSLCTGEHSLGDIETLFFETLGVDAVVAGLDVQALLQELQSEGLLLAPEV